MDALCVNEHLYKCAVVGENNKVKIFNIKNWKEIKKESFSLQEGCGKANRMSWSKNGQLLVIGTTTGYLIGILTYLPRLFSYHQSKLAILSSFTQVNIGFINDGKLEPFSTINLEFEPTLLTIGASHLASGINNFVYLYKFMENGEYNPNLELVVKGDFYTMVSDIAVSETHLAVLTENKCYLELLEQNKAEPKTFPQDASDPLIKYIFLNDKFLIMHDADNKITIFSTQDGSVCAAFKPGSFIQKIWPSPTGNKAVCVDKAGRPFLLNFVWESETDIKGFSPAMSKVVWDSLDPNMFIACSADTGHTFVHNKSYYTGERCGIVYELLTLGDYDKTEEVSFTNFDGVEPIYVQGGNVAFLTKSNGIQLSWLGSHSSYETFANDPKENDTNLRYFFQNLMLCNFDNALTACSILSETDRPGALVCLAEAALKNMNVKVAKKAYQLSGNISMVYTLDSLLAIDEKKVLQGFIAMVFCDYQAAQDFLLTSSHPEFGLDLRCDTKEWSLALNLAEKMAPDRVATIRRRYAEDQEKQGLHQQALKSYQQSVIDESKLAGTKRDKARQHNLLCDAGIARTSIRTENVQKGFEIAQDLKDKELIWEVANVCEETKHFEEAADLFEKAQDYEKAASLYIATKNFKKAETLIEKLNSPKILASLAKMKESEGKFKDAEVAYTRARDWENVIRLNLTKLEKSDNGYDKAVKIFYEKAQTQACASSLADYCDGKGMKAETIKFLVLAGKLNEAFSKASLYQEMEKYAESLEELTKPEALKIAQYFEGVNKFKNAGIYYEKAGKYSNSLECYLLAGDDALENAIICVQNSQSDSMFNKLLRHLEGDDSNDPKDPKFAFKLHLLCGKIPEATKIAIAIVKMEMEDAKYKEAHKLLIDMLTEILERKAQVSFELMQHIIVIHSYTIVTAPHAGQASRQAQRALHRDEAARPRLQQHQALPAT